MVASPEDLLKGKPYWTTFSTCDQNGKCFPDQEAHPFRGGVVTNRTLTAIHRYMSTNEIILRDGYKMGSSPEYVNRKLYTVLSDGRGGLIKVDGSEEITFSEWNTMSDNERLVEVKKGTLE
jgi:hypothetical protein